MLRLRLPSFSTKVKLALIVSSCAGALTVTVALAGRGAHEPPSSPQPAQRIGIIPYTIKQRQTFYPSGGGRAFLRAVKERRQRSDGSFILIHTYYRPDGTVEKTETGLGYAGRGVYRVDEENRRLEFVAGLPNDPLPATEDEVRSDPGFIRADTVSGQPTLVTRHPREPEATKYKEVHRAPALQYFEIKTASASPRGEEVTEPVQLDLDEPEAGQFLRLAGYARSYASYEEKIRQAEERGEAERAEVLRRYLARARN